MAHTKAGGSARINKDSQSKRLGIKLNHGQSVKPGMIIVRQRGSNYKASTGVSRGKDFTLFALIPGVVQYSSRRGDTYVSVKSK